MRLVRMLASHLALGGLLLAPDASAAPAARTAPLPLAERVRAQEAVLRLMATHAGAAASDFEARVPRATVVTRVRRTLAESRALATFWDTPISQAMLQAEVRRMMRDSVMPDRLRERFAALGDDPVLIREAVARPILADRLARSFFTWDRRIHAATWSEAEALRQRLATGVIDPLVPRADRSEVEIEAALQWGDGAPEILVPRPVEEEALRLVVDVPLQRSGTRALVARYAIQKRSWDDWWKENAPQFEVETIDTPESTAGEEVGADLTGSAAAIAMFEPGAACTPDTWSVLHGGAPDPLRDSRAVWTGSLMLVWGGYQTEAPGWRYDPALDTWSPMSLSGAPPLAGASSAVWTGTRMIVWGGSRAGVGPVDTGGIYDPVADTWTLTSTVGAPTARYRHTAVWTGTSMIIWGGLATPSQVATSTGGVYDPVQDQWTATGLTDAPFGRSDHTAVWTGGEMIIWGGCNSGACRDDGAAYDPAGAGTWTALPAGGPQARGRHTAVWTGSQMVVWGGSSSGGVNLNSGARYDLAGGWSVTTAANAPSGRQDHSAVWTGATMIVWGGLGGGNPLNTGGRYDPIADTWSSMGLVNVPFARFAHVAVWTGARMIVWGSGSFDQPRNDGGRYDPVSDSWTPTSHGSQPPLGDSPYSFWTGNEILIWGNRYPGPLSSSGGRYDPATDSWSVVAPSGAPLNGVSAVWTGTKMITHGGSQTNCCCQRFFSYEVATNSGGSYDPITDSWVGAGGGAPRAGHTAVWTGKEMIVRGGSSQLPCGPSSYPGGESYDPSMGAWSAINSSGGPVPGQGTMFSDGYQTDEGALFLFGSMSAYIYHPETTSWTQADTFGAPTSSTGAQYAGGRLVVLNALGASGRYDLVTDSWSPVAPDGPYVKCGGVVVSSGTEVFWWGGNTGDNCNTASRTGGRYDPVSDTWVPTSSTDVPSFSSSAPGVWSGEEVLAWDTSAHLGFAYCMPGRGPCFRDLDGDGFGDPGASAQCDGPGVVWNSRDCDDSNPTRGGLAGEVGALLFGNATNLTWSPPTTPLAASFFYDVLMSNQPGDLSAASCLVTDTPDPMLADSTVPAPGAAAYYLVRASTCPGGALERTLGKGTPGTPGRVAPICP